MIPMYNPITNTIGATERPQKQPTKTKSQIDRRFKNFVKFNTHWNFKRVHAQHCPGHFAIAPHWKQESKGSRTPTAKEVCTVCGAVSFQRFYDLGEISTIGYRLQKSRQHNKDYEIVFEGYLPKKLLRVDNPDQDHKKSTFEHICISCQLGFNGKSINDMCPPCANNEHAEVNTVDYDTHAASHAGYIELWQQGQKSEVGHAASDTNKRTVRVLRSAMKRNPLMTTRLRVQMKTFRNATIVDAAEAIRISEFKAFYANQAKEEFAERCEQLEDKGFYRTADRLLMKACIEASRADPLTSTRHMSQYAVYRKRTAPATTTYDHEPTKQTTFTTVLKPDLRECALADVKDLPDDTEVIEVTRAKNHILSPSWQVLKAYKQNGDWVQYTAAFMAEMAQPGPMSEMKRIIEKAKHHPVYLACFETVGHCHRFLLLEWMNRLSTTC